MSEGQGLKSADLPVDGFFCFDDHGRGPDLSRRERYRARGVRDLRAGGDAVVGREDGRSFCQRKTFRHVSPEMQTIIAAACENAARPSIAPLPPCRSRLMPIRAAYNATSEGRAMTGAKILYGWSLLRCCKHHRKARQSARTDRRGVVAFRQSPRERCWMRRTLVLLADHELNASTFTVRCAAFIDGYLALRCGDRKGLLRSKVHVMAAWDRRRHAFWINFSPATLPPSSARRWRWASAFRASATWSIAMAIPAPCRCSPL